MKRVTLALMAVALVALPTDSTAGMIGVNGRISTLGLGVEAAVPVMPFVNVRGGLYGFSHSFDAEKSGNNYDFDLKLSSFAALVDVHLAGTDVRVTGGIVANGNKLDAVAVPKEAPTYDIGGVTYTADELGSFTGKIEFDSLAPYAGIGWGSTTGLGLGVVADLGVLMQGSPQVSLSTENQLSEPLAQQQLEANLAQEESELQDSLDGYKLYPVASIGLRFGF